MDRTAGWWLRNTPASVSSNFTILFKKRRETPKKPMNLTRQKINLKNVKLISVVERENFREYGKMFDIREKANVVLNHDEKCMLPETVEIPNCRR